MPSSQRPARAMASCAPQDDFLGMAEHGIDLGVCGEPVVHQPDGRLPDPLAIAGHQHLDARMIGQHVLHALVAIDRGRRADQPGNRDDLAGAAQILGHDLGHLLGHGHVALADEQGLVGRHVAVERHQRQAGAHHRPGRRHEARGFRPGS